MIKKITISFASLLCFSSLPAQDTKYFTVFNNLECNENGDAYHFNGSTARIGHLVKLSFPTANKELKSDVSVSNPENPDGKDNIVAVIERISWEGGPTDPMELTGRVSYQNKAILQEALSLLAETPDVEAEFVVYEHDHGVGKYFKRLHTFNQPIKFVLTPGSKTYFDEEPDNYKVKKPMNFVFTISLTPKSGVEDQKVGFAFRSSGTQFTRKLGGLL